jgi:glycerol-3-phosphate dehydrogenase (NAD(P)+)
MKISFLGTGTWGFCLASLLASKGYHVTSWTRNKDLAASLSRGEDHPHLPGHKARSGMTFTTDLQQAVEDSDLIAESVTASGIRAVFNALKSLKLPKCPLVITSKGIEQGTGLILPEIVLEILGEKAINQVGLLSGPGYAKEIICNLPTSVTGSAYHADVMKQVCETFTTPSFRVYPNSDIVGVAFGGALKNIIAIACGISDGLQLGNSSKAALMTRGLHEIKKLAVARGCTSETLNGLSGMGDMCLTCCSMTSRNTRFGYLLAKGYSRQEAEKEIDMVVEGAYTVISAMELSKRLNIPMPITEVVYKIIYEQMAPKDAVLHLMQRTIKEEHL